MNRPHIACVVVTYNRKHLLKRCLDAICTQTFKPTSVYITDNASTDGTLDSVKEWGFYNCSRDGIKYKYILNSKNEGGAGGFYLGMKTAFEEGIDGVWVMDDDGVPNTDCLWQLQRLLSKRDYIAPIVLSDEDHESCSFTEKHESYAEFKQKAVDGLVENWASPFNGILYSSSLIHKIGLPNKEMFIWGDETNYHYRALNQGIIPVTVVNAIHYHPLNKQTFIYYKGLGSVLEIETGWKIYCYLRNATYNTIYYDKSISKIHRFFRASRLMVTYLWHFSKKCEFTKIEMVMRAYLSGIFRNFVDISALMEKYK